MLQASLHAQSADALSLFQPQQKKPGTCAQATTVYTFSLATSSSNLKWQPRWQPLHKWGLKQRPFRIKSIGFTILNKLGFIGKP